jgi:hypothetical protein
VLVFPDKAFPLLKESIKRHFTGSEYRDFLLQHGIYTQGELMSGGYSTIKSALVERTVSERFLQIARALHEVCELEPAVRSEILSAGIHLVGEEEEDLVGQSQERITPTPTITLPTQSATTTRKPNEDIPPDGNVQLQEIGSSELAPPLKKRVNGIPAKISKPLRDTLLQCEELADPQALRGVLTHQMLTPWRDRVPTGGPTRTRVTNVISRLVDEYRTDGQNALVIFLRVLAEEYDENSETHGELLCLAERLQAFKGSASPHAREKNNVHQAQDEAADPPNQHAEVGSSSNVPAFQPTEIAEPPDPSSPIRPEPQLTQDLVDTSSPFEFLKGYLFYWSLAGQLGIFALGATFAEGLGVDSCTVTAVSVIFSLALGIFLLIASLHSSNKRRYNNLDRLATSLLSMLTVVGWILLARACCSEGSCSVIDPSIILR